MTWAPILSLCQIVVVRGEQSLADADDDPGGGMSAVLFEVELAFEGVVDGLDGLPERFEESGARALGFVLAGRSEQAQPGLGERGFEVAAEVVLVRDQCLPGPVGVQGRVGEDVE